MHAETRIIAGPAPGLRTDSELPLDRLTSNRGTGIPSEWGCGSGLEFAAQRQRLPLRHSTPLSSVELTENLGGGNSSGGAGSAGGKGGASRDQTWNGCYSSSAQLRKRGIPRP